MTPQFAQASPAGLEQQATPAPMHKPPHPPPRLRHPHTCTLVYLCASGLAMVFARLGPKAIDFAGTLGRGRRYRLQVVHLAACAYIHTGGHSLPLTAMRCASYQ